MRTTTRLVVALTLVLAALAAPAAATHDTAAAGAGTGPDAAGTISGAALAVNNSTSNETTTTSTGPSLASQVRVTPVPLDEPYLSVRTVESDTVFNTSGPHVLFSVSESVSAARVTQQPASAEVLAGGRQILIKYKDNAAPLGESSLYTLELFFPDGSKKTVKLYARKTGVSVGASQLTKYREYIEESKERAKKHGYGTSPDQLSKYLAEINRQADLVDGFLMEKAMQLFALAIAAAGNPLFWIVLLGGIIVLSKYLLRRHGGILTGLQDLPNVARQKQAELERYFREDRQTAEEYDLKDVPAIGSDAAYWEDAFNVTSPGQLARLAAFGCKRRTADGGLDTVHEGVSDLEVAGLQNRETWLEPIYRSRTITKPRTALGQLKALFEWMETNHDQTQYRKPRDEVADLIQELEDREFGAPQQRSAAGDD